MTVAGLLNDVEKHVTRAGYVLVSRALIADALRDPVYDSPLGAAAYMFVGLPTPEEQWQRALRARGLHQRAYHQRADRDYVIVERRPALESVPGA